MDSFEEFHRIKQLPVETWKDEIEKLEGIAYKGRGKDWTVQEVVRGRLVLEYKSRFAMAFKG